MAEVIDNKQYIQRIRYEAFASFSTELNKCSSFQNIALTLRAQIKFILDSFFFRVYFQQNRHKISFDLFRGECTYTEDEESDLTSFEEQALLYNLPSTYNKNEINEHLFLKTSVYNHPKVNTLSLLPVNNVNQYQILITNASRQTDVSINSDFRFLNLISDLLGNKLSQLFLKGLVENKNQELEFKNNEITFLNRTLEERVEQKTADLSETNLELQTLFYRTSHDFRAPLANILGLANLASLFTTDDDVLNLFERCKSVVGGLDRMLFKLTTIGQFDSAKDFEPIDLKLLIDEVAKKFKKQTDLKKAVIQFKDQSAKNLHCNKAMLLCIFENLLENSLCYTSDLPVVQINVKDNSSMLMIDFEDNGTGMALAIQNKIFDMYYRGNGCSEGHGLGLYIVRKLIKILNGSITVSSELDRFTAFHLKIPIAQPL